MESSRTGHSIEIPLSCSLFINEEEGKPTGDNWFQRENPADAREIATLAAQGALEVFGPP